MTTPSIKKPVLSSVGLIFMTFDMPPTCYLFTMHEKDNTQHKITVLSSVGVIFITCDMPPTRYLFTMHKNDNIQKLKKELRTLLGLENCDIIMAEVLDSHISRILVSMIKYLVFADNKEN